MEEKNKIKTIPKKVSTKMVETYAEDMATVIGDNEAGMVKQMIHEEERREIEKNNTSPESKKNKFFIYFMPIPFILFSPKLPFQLLNSDFHQSGPSMWAGIR